MFNVCREVVVGWEGCVVVLCLIVVVVLLFVVVVVVVVRVLFGASSPRNTPLCLSRLREGLGAFLGGSV